MNESTWNDVRRAWQETESPTDAARRDWKKKRRSLRWTVFGEVLALIWAAAFTAFFMWRDPRPIMIVCCTFVCLFVAGSVGFAWWTRRKLTDTLPADTQRFLDVLRRQHEIESKLHRVERAGLWVVVIFCLLWVPWKLWTDWSVYLEYPWAGFVGVGGIVVILVGVGWANSRKSARLKAEGERLKALLDSYS